MEEPLNLAFAGLEWMPNRVFPFQETLSVGLDG